VQTLKDHLNGITCLAWSPDSKRVLTADLSNGFRADEGAARIWDVESGKPVVKLEGDRGGVHLATFSPDGKHVLMLQNPAPSCFIWDASNGQVALTLGGPPPGHSGIIVHATYSPDGCRIVTASADKTARIWDATTGKQLLVLRGHILGVRSAAFSTDGKLVVTASEDETARVWDAQTGAELITLAGHKGPVLTAVFSPDGKRVATGSSDGTVRLWPIDPVPLADSRKPRELSAEERERFGVEEMRKP
jgi:WD40 repeat protein